MGRLIPRGGGSSVVECRGLTKRFGGTVALDDVSVSFDRGTIHALVGENGAGKSTLGKVIAGVHKPDTGSLLVDGEEVRLRSPRTALGLGITMVAQELSLVPARSVLDNVMLGIESHRAGVLDRRRSRQRCQDLMDEYDLGVDPDARVGSLAVVEQQRVEILRALARDARVVIMDEPTARLSQAEASALAVSLRSLADRGVTVIYVSHFLEEVLELSDRVTVLRNGRVIRSTDAADESRESLVEGIAGRRLDAAYPTRRSLRADADVVLKVDGLSRQGEFADVSLEIRAGEIVTLAGLVGSGRTELVRAVSGASRPTSGTMKLDGETYRPRSPRDAIARGVTMIPESRRDDGLFPMRSVVDNVSLPHLHRFTSAGAIRRRSERDAVSEVMERVQLTGASIDTPMFGLSGGNQQKSMFARWLVDRPRLLLADEPTRGVDVGSKRAIYDLMVDLAAEGMGILAVSSEVDEVLGISHRILVMREGGLVGELDGASATADELMALAFGLEAA